MEKKHATGRQAAEEKVEWKKEVQTPNEENENK